MKPVDYTLYLCTERSYLKDTTLEQAVEEAIAGGCSVVQLREKDCSSLEFYQLAKSLKTVTDRYQVPLIIDDRVDIALAVDAAGVHIGQSDLPANVVREILGADKIVGVTAKTIEQAEKAQADGASYLGVGAMYPTTTKKDAIGISLTDLEEIRRAVDIPVVAIGGVTADKVAELKPCGIDGVAVISAILNTKDRKAAAQEFLKAWGME